MMNIFSALKVFESDFVHLGFRPVTEEFLTEALKHKRDEVCIYSCSFCAKNAFHDQFLSVRKVLQEGTEKVKIRKQNRIAKIQYTHNRHNSLK